MHNKLKVSQLGNCTDLWSNLTYSHMPQYTFGGFTANLRTVKRERQDTAVLSAASSSLLNQFCFIVDPSKNPFNKSIGELYDDGADIEVIFDPLSSGNLSWSTLEGFAARLSKFSDSTSRDQLTRLEIQLLLQANAELQREFKRALCIKQQEYSSGWTHFHNRIEDFWSIASEVCLGKLTHARLYDPAQADWFDSLYFANAENKYAYIDYIFSSYEDEDHIECSLSKKIEQLRRKLNALSKHIQNQGNEEDQGHWRAKFMLFLQDISDMWYALWPASTARKDFNCPIAENFLHSMNKVEAMILDRDSKHSLFVVLNEVSPQKQVDTINKIRKLLGVALSEWKKILSQREIKDKSSKASEPAMTSNDSAGSSEQCAQLLEGINSLIVKINEQAENTKTDHSNTSAENPESIEKVEPHLGLSAFWKDLASFAAQEFLRQTISRNISQQLAPKTSSMGESLPDSTNVPSLPSGNKKT